MTARPRQLAGLTCLLAFATPMLGSCGGSPQGGSVTATPAYGSEEFGLTLEELTIKVEQTETAIGQCMSKAGFTYVPLDFVSVKAAMDSDQSKPGLSDEEYIAQYGLGVTTQFDKPIVNFGAGPLNQATLDAMADTDQVAYRRGLWGDQPDFNLVRSLEEEDFSQSDGCTRAAAEETFSSTELSGSYVNPADKLLESDKRMVDALAKWSDCLREAGFDYQHPDAIVTDLEERLAAVLEGQTPDALVGPAADALKELQGEELAIATADSTCFEDHVADVEEQIESEIYGGPQS